MTSKLPQTPRQGTIRTFLIADIRGWTRFTRELGDEAASRLAAKFAQIVGEGVEAWGGALLELRGDEAMCTFESARAAMRCAVELQEAFVDESGLAPELPLNVGVGLDAGEAVPVGDGYRGTALNVAARLCSVAAAGEVIATASLAHLAGRVDGLSLAELEPKPMKGFDEPVPAVLVDSAAPHEHEDSPAAAASGTPPPLPTELDALVPLVGREADLRWLAWFWRRARHGHGGAVAVAGPAGMGRTRLAAELAALAHRDGAVVAFGPDGHGDLIVVDDVDRLATQRMEALSRRLREEPSRRLIVLTSQEPIPGGLVRTEERLRRLGPVDVAAVAQIGRLYLDDPGVDVPAHLLHEESHGIPAAVHRVASQWAGAVARRRLGESARRTSRERRDLRAAEAEMIGDVERLELTRERARLYVEDPEIEGQSTEAPTRSVCPYKGLATFEATDAEYYFGRERLVAELIARMVGSSFIGLIGASGSGKSSALQAGLLPALAGGVIPGSDEWIQVQVRPGEHPMQELRRALHHSLPHRPSEDVDPTESLDAALTNLAPAQRLLVVVDQFEEVFSALTDEAERIEFIDLLTAPRPHTKVLVALRADHYERGAAYPRLARLIGADQVLVGPLTAAAIAAIIRHPAERVGLRVEPELVEALVADIGTEPGGLPLLSTALLELWEAREGDRLTLSAYRTTGGVRSAVARLAESVYRGLGPEEQADTRSIFLRLAGETDDRVVVRRRVPLGELDLDAPRSEAAVAALTEGRLLTASDGYVEVAHEALLREWPRLRDWIDEDSSGRQLRLHLMSAARTWDDGGREDGDLYRGARLSATLDWSEDHERELNAVERAFVEESRSASERDAERQRRANRWLRGLLAVGAVFLIAALSAGALALVQADTAREQATRAQAAEERAEAEAEAATKAALTARARELYASAISLVEHDPELSLHLYLAATETGVAPHADAISALHRALLTTRVIRAIRLDTEGRRPSNVGVGVTPDGKTVFASVDSRSAHSFDVETGRALRTYGVSGQDATASFLGIAVSPSGDHFAQLDEDGIVHVWNVATGEERRMEARGDLADWSVFSPDGTQLATITRHPERTNAIVSLFDIESGRLVVDWTVDDVYAIGFDVENDRVLATACPCSSRDAVLWLDVATGTVTNPFRGDIPLEALPSSAQFSPDGRVLATASVDGIVQLWSTDTLELRQTFTGHARDVTYIGFSQDGQWMATTSNDGTTRVWNVTTGVPHLTLMGQSGVPGYATFTADARRLITASSDLTVTVWDLSLGRGEWRGLHIDDDVARVWDLEVRGDRAAVMGWSCLVGGCAPGEVHVYDLRSGTIERRINARHGLGLALFDDGSVVAQAGVDVADDDSEPDLRGGELQLWKADSRQPVILEGLCSATDLIQGACDEPPAIPWEDSTTSVQATANGELIAMIGGEYRTLATWDGTGARLAVPRVLDDYPLALAVAPDGSQLAVSTTDQVEILDPRTLTPLKVLDITWAAVLRFSPDGSILVVGSPTTPTRLYDTSTWEYTALETNALAAAWSPSGERLATVDADRRLRVRDAIEPSIVETVPLERIQLRRANISRWGFVEFVNEEHLLVVDDGYAYGISLDHEELLDVARSRLTRAPTEEECTFYSLPCSDEAS